MVLPQGSSSQAPSGAFPPAPRPRPAAAGAGTWAASPAESSRRACPGGPRTSGKSPGVLRGPCWKIGFPTGRSHRIAANPKLAGSAWYHANSGRKGQGTSARGVGLPHLRCVDPSFLPRDSAEAAFEKKRPAGHVGVDFRKPWPQLRQLKQANRGTGARARPPGTRRSQCLLGFGRQELR